MTNPANQKKASILLVDDQPSRLLSYEAILNDLGQNLVRAGSGSEALQILMKQEFAVILLDVNMPGIDGFETANLIHQHPRYEKTPIIFVTAVHVTDLDRLKGYKLGAVDYVYIPVVPEILRSKVSVMVELYNKRLELSELNRTLQEANRELARANESLELEKTRELERLNGVLERANRELALSDRRKDEFLALLAHELRNPLNPIRTAGEVMSLQKDPETVDWGLRMVNRQVDHLSRLIDDLLDVSRISRGKLELRRHRADLAEIIHSTVDSLKGTLEAAHAFFLTLPEEPLPVDGDPVRLSQVLSNLLNNSIKFTPAGGTITLTATIEPSPDPAAREPGSSSRIVVRVADTGIGISDANLPHIFEMFYQADQSLKRVHGGLGIGLTLVQRLVELHGGTIEAASGGPGQGSEFVLRLPVAVDRAPSGPGKPLAERLGNLSGRRFLVADDNVDSAESLGLLLRHLGSEVMTAHDGDQVLKLLDEFRPDVLLLDIGMPKLSGYDVARRVRATPWGRDVILIALTGWGKEEDRRLSREAGFDHHFVKPLVPGDLERVLSRSTPV